MSKIIAIANQKGGVAKTTTACSLGVGLSNKDRRVLLIDCDPQANLTEAMGYQQPDEIEITLATIIEDIVKDIPFDKSAGIIHHEEGVDILPCNIELSGVETSLVTIMSGESILSEYIEMIEDDYDYIISVVGILIRIPSMLSVTASDVWVLGGNAVSELIGIAAFVAGFVWILKGAFSPKKVGAVMMAFLASVCIKGLAIFTTGAVVANWLVAVIPVAIGVIGFVASYFCFWKNQPAVIWHRLVTIVSVIGIVQALYTVATTVVFAAQYVSTETALNAVLSICIYMLFCYQTHVLSIRRKMAKMN